MDLRKEGHHGEENDEIYLVVVVVDAGTRRFGRKSSPEEFAGNLAMPNFGVRSAELRVAARKTGCTSGILASRATPAYIYT